MTQTGDLRSPRICIRLNRSDGMLQYTQQLDVLERPYPDLASLRTFSREDQRARVSDPQRPIKPSKPTKVWKSHVRLLAEQRLAEDEIEELLRELGVAMKYGDLEWIQLLTRQIDELANGINKMNVRKCVTEKPVDQRYRSGPSVLDLVRRLRSFEDEEW